LVILVPWAYLLINSEEHSKQENRRGGRLATNPYMSVTNAPINNRAPRGGTAQTNTKAKTPRTIEPTT
jgi:hypothetical protein